MWFGPWFVLFKLFHPQLSKWFMCLWQMFQSIKVDLMHSLDSCVIPNLPCHVLFQNCILSFIGHLYLPIVVRHACAPHVSLPHSFAPFPGRTLSSEIDLFHLLDLCVSPKLPWRLVFQKSFASFIGFLYCSKAGSSHLCAAQEQFWCPLSSFVKTA